MYMNQFIVIFMFGICKTFLKDSLRIEMEGVNEKIFSFLFSIFLTSLYLMKLRLSGQKKKSLFPLISS